MADTPDTLDITTETLDKMFSLHNLTSLECVTKQTVLKDLEEIGGIVTIKLNHCFACGTSLGGYTLNFQETQINDTTTTGEYICNKCNADIFLAFKQTLKSKRKNSQDVPKKHRTFAKNVFVILKNLISNYFYANGTTWSISLNAFVDGDFDEFLYVEDNKHTKLVSTFFVDITFSNPKYDVMEMKYLEQLGDLLQNIQCSLPTQPMLMFYEVMECDQYDGKLSTGEECTIVVCQVYLSFETEIP